MTDDREDDGPLIVVRGGGGGLKGRTLWARASVSGGDRHGDGGVELADGEGAEDEEENERGDLGDLEGQLGLGGDIDDPHAGELKASLVRMASEMIAITDINPATVQPTPAYNYNVDPNDPTQAPSAIHRGGSNVLYCDGHVTWVNQNDLILYTMRNGQSYTFPTSAAYQEKSPQWNNDHMSH